MYVWWITKAIKWIYWTCILSTNFNCWTLMNNNGYFQKSVDNFVAFWCQLGFLKKLFRKSNSSAFMFHEQWRLQQPISSYPGYNFIHEYNWNWRRQEFNQNGNRLLDLLDWPWNRFVKWFFKVSWLFDAFKARINQSCSWHIFTNLRIFCLQTIWSKSIWLL